MGIGFGCLYLPAPALVSMHFQQHQALAMGISSSGTGIGNSIILELLGVFTPLTVTQGRLSSPSLSRSWSPGLDLAGRLASSHSSC
jgi:MFS family permease